MAWFGWGSTGPNWRDNWWAHGRPVTDVSEADLDPPAHEYVQPQPMCDVCGQHPDGEPCPYMQQAAAIMDAAQGGWLADHPGGFCVTNDPNCRGECGWRY